MCAARMRKSSGKTPALVGAEPLQIRHCGGNDLLQVREVLKRAPEAADWSEDSLREFFFHYGSSFLVACKGPEIQGFICGRRIIDEVEILNLAVRPEVRRKGIANRLVREFLEQIARHGVRMVHLEVRESNQGAIGLYASNGFRVTGRRRGYYRDPKEDAILMARDVNAVTGANDSTV